MLGCYDDVQAQQGARRPLIVNVALLVSRLRSHVNDHAGRPS